MMKINTFRGELTDISAEKEALPGSISAKTASLIATRTHHIWCQHFGVQLRRESSSPPKSGSILGYRTTANIHFLSGQHENSNHQI